MIKISRPTPKDVFPRRNLFERLDSLRGFPVIWISAPAGSGKTTLVSSYAGHRNIPCLWYQLDRRDADPATFFYYMREAAQKALPRKRLQLPLFTPEYHGDISTYVLRYFEHLYDRLKTNFFLVFDNFQEAPDEAPFQEVIKSALSMVPEGINVIVISRNDLPGYLSRLRADRSVGFVGWEEIRLTEDEALGIIGSGPGDPPLKKTVRSLHELSDGWAAGLILLNEVCRRDELPPHLVGKRIFEEVFEYFAAEIFQHLAPESREFFLKTAFLSKMTARMAEQLTGNQSAGSFLRTMNRNNFFIMRHAGAEIVYEYHPLFREFLLSTAQTALSPDTLTAVRRDAAAILEKAGMTEDAVTLLKDIADWEAMVDIIVVHASEMLKQGRYCPLQAWLKSLPEAVVERNPWLLYWQGMSRLPFSPAQAAPVFEAVFSLFQAGGDTVGAMLAASGAINALANQQDFPALDHWYEALNDLVLKTDDFPDAGMEATVVAGLAAAAAIREKSDGEFEVWRERLLNIPDTSSTISAKARAVHWIFHQRIMRKGRQEALPYLHELQRLSRLPEAPPLVAMIARGSAVLYHSYGGDYENGLEAARKVLELSRETGIRMFVMFTCVSMAGICTSRMDLKSAEAWLDRISSAPELPNSVRALYHAGLMRIALIRKEYSRALQELEKMLPYNEPGGRWGQAAVLLMQAYLFQMMGKRKKASMLLEKVRADAQARKSDLDMEKVLRTEAQFAFEAGDDAKCHELLRKSLALGRKIGAVLPWAFGHPVMVAGLYGKALEAGIEVEYVQGLIRRLGFIPETPPFHIENWPWPLKIYTLGRFAIVRDGTAIRSSGKAQRMPLRLLKALISLGGREVAEGAISEQLWPDADGDLAHLSFEANLHRLRKLLGHAEALRLSERKLTLDGRYCWVDIWAFERLLGQADEYETQGDTAKAWELTEKALALYRQDFMASDSDEVWTISPSERLKAKYFDRLMRLSRSLETAGHIERAVGLYERGLGIDDGMEEIYQRLMICYRHLGKRAKALAVYERCKKALDATLGIEPSDETEAIHSQILTQRGRLRLVGTDDRHRAGTGSS